MTSMVAISGVPRSSTSPPDTSRMFSSVWMPATPNAGMLNGVLGFVRSSTGCGRLGPRRVATTSASAANWGTSAGAAPGTWR